MGVKCVTVQRGTDKLISLGDGNFSNHGVGLVETFQFNLFLL